MNITELLPAFSENNIPVVLSSSNLYAPYAGVFIQSLINHISQDKNYDIIIFEHEITAENKALLRKIGQGCTNVSIRFCNPSYLFETLDMTSIEANKNFPVEVYYKILAPQILSQYTRLIVADIDTLLKQDIAELFEVDIKACCVGAVRDIIWGGYYQSDRFFTNYQLHLQDYFHKTMPMKNPLDYVNTGLLLIDAKKYREAITKEEILQTAKSTVFIWADQDVFNLLMDGKVHFLNMAWNMFVASNLHEKRAIDLSFEENKSIYQQTSQYPCMLHWVGKPKPWVCPDVPYGSEWWEVAMQTPFVGHIVARMFDALIDRKEHYRKKRGVEVAVWDPAPKNVKRDLP